MNADGMRLENAELDRRIAEDVMARKADGSFDFRPYSTHYVDALDAVRAAGGRDWAKQHAERLEVPRTDQNEFHVSYPVGPSECIEVTDSTAERALCMLALQAVTRLRKRAGIGAQG